jgi:lysosomal-associated membrane protein 1/2
MYRNLLILFASIALVCANSTTTGSTSVSTPAQTSSTTAHPTTTAKPNTTTVAPTPSPTPAPTPGPIPKPERWSGNYTDDKDKTCINVQFSVQITINYNTTSNEKLTTGFTIPVDASVDQKNSHCSQPNKADEAITIHFANEENTTASLTLTFNKTDKESYVESVSLSFMATKELMPQLNPNLTGKTFSAEASGLSLFKVVSDHSYLCSAVQSANLNSSQEDVNNIQIQFTDSKVEAYIKESNKGKFDIESDCKSADISDVVPIAVGAALAGLVIIVLIAYFVGRRRSRRLAYQSV